MSERERTGNRDLLYSRWHRTESIERFLERRVDAKKLTALDIDWCEYCAVCRARLALIETKNSSNDPASFPAYITAGLADDAQIPAYLVCYTCVCGVTGDKHETAGGCDVAEFRVKQIAPSPGEVLRMTPGVYAFWLHSLRTTHACRFQRSA